ncbi:Flagellar assembly protein FliH [Saliniradius amylolyticus]|uniref:Flagellar assembly protein FliH n=1 Tax=Saliniradius amylolyticus TaxID=2183582 RepID=A0A2S2E4H7_9ALTE|nr:flagellar assembly protein FliH [Saliniradius amylolyticus]AWL12561.1 Flagellar assembly protein FliH [Saliniradius amylolyticus]
MSKPTFLTPEQEKEAKSWELPYVENEHKEPEDKTNALNKRSDWKYEPPEPEEELTLPTAEEIEAIRESAYQEGLELGKQEGVEKGHAEGLEKGLEEGRKQGHEEGFQQGYDTGKEQIDTLVERWQALTHELTEPVAKVDQELEQELVQLAVALARSVIRTELKVNHDIIRQALSDGLKALPIGEKQYQIRLHPDDAVLIQQHFDSEQLKENRWQLVETPDISPGGCDIVTDTNAVDVTIERRVRQVLDRFLLDNALPDVPDEDTL